MTRCCFFQQSAPLLLLLLLPAIRNICPAGASVAIRYTYPAADPLAIRSISIAVDSFSNRIILFRLIVAQGTGYKVNKTRNQTINEKSYSRVVLDQTFAFTRDQIVVLGCARAAPWYDCLLIVTTRSTNLYQNFDIVVQR